MNPGVIAAYLDMDYYRISSTQHWSLCEARRSNWINKSTTQINLQVWWWSKQVKWLWNFWLYCILVVVGNCLACLKLRMMVESLVNLGVFKINLQWTTFRSFSYVRTVRTKRECEALLQHVDQCMRHEDAVKKNYDSTVSTHIDRVALQLLICLTKWSCGTGT